MPPTSPGTASPRNPRHGAHAPGPNLVGNGGPRAGAGGAGGSFADAIDGKVVCPFCGSAHDPAVNEHGQNQPCPRCGMQDSPATRQATKARIGPWFVRQTRNPAAPGMRFETLLSLVKRGQVTATSVVRGPTTHQMWRFAGQVKGLSREFGLCYSCAAEIERSTSLCPHCNRLQEPPANPDVLLEVAPSAAPTAAASQPAAEAARPVEFVPAPSPVVPAAVELPPQCATPPQQPAAAPSRPQPGREEAQRSQPLPAAASPGKRAKPQPEPKHAPAAPQSTPSSAPPPPGMSSATDGPRGPRTPPRRGDEILTARELAAAFQLDFAPANDRARPADSAGGWDTGPHRGGTRKLVLAALLLIVGAAAALLIADADLRARATTWAREAYASARTAVENASAPADESDPARSTGAAGDPAAVGTANPDENASARLPEPGATIGTPPGDAANGSAGTPQAGGDRVAAAAVNGDVASRQSPRPTGADDVQSVVTAPSTTNGGSPLPYDQSRALWRRAIDAEAKRDFAEAVRLYEDIKRLPREVWPAGLEFSLDFARRQLKEQQ